MPNERESLAWPMAMLLGSTIGIGGAVAAIAVGADRTPEGRINPFFYTAMANSLLYCSGHAYKIYNVLATPALEADDVEMQRGGRER